MTRHLKIYCFSISNFFKPRKTEAGKVLKVNLRCRFAGAGAAVVAASPPAGAAPPPAAPPPAPPMAATAKRKHFSNHIL